MFDYKDFTFKKFIDYVMKKMHLEDAEEPTKSEIERQIAKLLGDRIIMAVTNAMTEENFDQYELIRVSNPELSDLECLYLIMDQIPLLQEYMIKGVTNLAEELTYDVERLDAILAKKSKQKVKK